MIYISPSLSNTAVFNLKRQLAVLIPKMRYTKFVSIYLYIHTHIHTHIYTEHLPAGQGSRSIMAIGLGSSWCGGNTRGFNASDPGSNPSNKSVFFGQETLYPH